VAKQFPSIEPAHRAFIERQRVFFVGSAAPWRPGQPVAQGPGRAAGARPGAGGLPRPDRQRQRDRRPPARRRAPHDHVLRLRGPPLILRLYGRGRAHRRGSAGYAGLLPAFGGEEPLGARQIVALEVDLVQTSCGYGVPLFAYRGERPSLDRWAEAKGEAGLDEYRRETNARSIDGLVDGVAGGRRGGGRV
jgi:hypothetical protein